VSGLRAGIYLAEKMGPRLGKYPLLLGTLQKKRAEKDPGPVTETATIPYAIRIVMDPEFSSSGR